MVESYVETFRKYFTGGKPEPTRAIVLSGGGARAAYQAGVLSYIGDAFDAAPFEILTGVSAGAINAAHLANHPGTLNSSGPTLANIWTDISTTDVFEEESGFRFLLNFFRSATRTSSNGARDLRGLVNTAPLRNLLERVLDAPDNTLSGIQHKIQSGTLDAVAISTTNYATGQTVTWTQGDDIDMWERPNRISQQTTLSVDHVMASSAIPLLFPAIQLDDAWYGDGGIRLSSPLSPAINMGADRILVISTRHQRTRAEADEPAVDGYPPAAQIIGILLNSIFLDVLDQDSTNLRRINSLVSELPERKRYGMRPIRLVEIRPSIDIGKASREYEATIPGPFRFLTRGLGTDLTRSPDWLSMLLFEEPFLSHLVEVGYKDAKEQHQSLEDLFFDDT